MKNYYKDFEFTNTKEKLKNISKATDMLLKHLSKYDMHIDDNKEYFSEVTYHCRILSVFIESTFRTKDFENLITKSDYANFSLNKKTSDDEKIIDQSHIEDKNISSSNYDSAEDEPISDTETILQSPLSAYDAIVQNPLSKFNDIKPDINELITKFNDINQDINSSNDSSNNTSNCGVGTYVKDVNAIKKLNLNTMPPKKLIELDMNTVPESQIFTNIIKKHIFKNGVIAKKVVNQNLFLLCEKTTGNPLYQYFEYFIEKNGGLYYCDLKTCLYYPGVHNNKIQRWKTA
jgi:hypothetical protein